MRAGVEASLGGNWSGKIEYLYLDLGRFNSSATLLMNAPPIRADFSSHITDHILRVGVNYRFGGPFIAKYGSEGPLAKAPAAARPFR